jgi:5-methylcytosine-specific restriction protein A
VIGRYLSSTVVSKLEANLTVVPPGYCNWCGKPVPRKNQRFCPGVVTHEYTSTDISGKKHVHRDRRYDCYNAFFSYWARIPRFKRVVFVRDKFTCRACGAKPVWVNKHGVEFPNVGQLACDHIYPYSKGGKTELKNLQTLCRKCNAKKRAKTDWAPQLVLPNMPPLDKAVSLGIG